MRRGIRRTIGWFVAAIFVALMVVVDLPRMFDRVYYRGPVSDHFDGARFFNPDGEQGTGGGQKVSRLIDVLLFARNRPAWPEHVAVTPTRPPRRVDGTAMRVTWIGHATVLIQTQGMNILTDPVWSERASPFGFIGPRRVRGPGVRFADLPRIDLVLVSHNHYDHLDLATLKALWARDRPLIVTALGNDTLLRWHGIASRAIDWGQSIAVRPGVSVKGERVHHWSARWMADRDRALWSGFTVTMPAGGNIFFTGDSGPGDGTWPAAAARDGPFRFAMIPIGAYKPHAVMSGNHIDPADAVRVFQVIKPGAALGIHWGTFQLSDEGVDEPPRALHAAMQAAGLDQARFRATEPGTGWDVPPLQAGANSPSAATSAAVRSMPKTSASAVR